MPVPGPADYSIRSNKSSGPRFVIGIKFGSLLEKMNRETPGVGAYDVLYST